MNCPALLCNSDLPSQGYISASAQHATWCPHAAFVAYPCCQCQGYVELIAAHEDVKHKLAEAEASAQLLREAAVPVSGALELLLGCQGQTLLIALWLEYSPMYWHCKDQKQ